MTTTAIINGLMGLVMVLTFAFSIHDLPAILVANTSHDYPFIEAYYFATGSKGFTTATTTIIIFLIIGASHSVQATAARHVFAFARDEGLPFPHLWTKVRQIGGSDIPLNAFCLSLAVTTIVALVNLGLSSVLHFSIALFVSTIFTGYFLAIACVLTARLSRSTHLPHRRWSLGVFSIPINVIALGYIALGFVMSLFPLTVSNLHPSSMNWASLLWTAVFFFSTILYAVHGRYVFKAPILTPERSTDELPSSRHT
jgi:choline transport protein